MAESMCYNCNKFVDKETHKCPEPELPPIEGPTMVMTIQGFHKTDYRNLK